MERHPKCLPSQKPTRTVGSLYVPLVSRYEDYVGLRDVTLSWENQMGRTIEKTLQTGAYAGAI